jgi:hypothetical protein
VFKLLLFVCLFVVLGFVVLSYCSYVITGDGVVYFNELNIMKYADYFQLNLGSFFSPTTRRILTTEGGFGFFLYISSFFHNELPFLLPGIFNLLFLVLLAFLSFYMCPKHKGRVLVGIFTLICIFIIRNQAQHILMLSLCLRDSISHFFGLLGLLFTCVGVYKTKKRYLFFSGFFVGIACWCRVPNLLFVIPIGVFVLCSYKKLGFIFFSRCVSVLLLGVCVGVLPLAAQNVFEGKPFYMAGQMDILLLNECNQVNKVKNSSLNVKELTKNSEDSTQSISKISVKPQKGLKLNNFRSIALLLYNSLSYGHGKWLTFLLLYCAFIVFFRAPQFCLTFFSASLSFFLFYSCYDKVVARYFVIITIFMCPIVALALFITLNYLINRCKMLKHNNYVYTYLLCFFSVILFFILKNSINKQYNLLQQRKAYLEYKDVLVNNMNSQDILIPGSTGVNGRMPDSISFGQLMRYFTGGLVAYWPYSVSGRDMEAPISANTSVKMISQVLARNGDVFVLEVKNNGGNDDWVIGDIMLNYNLSEVENCTNFRLFKLSDKRYLDVSLSYEPSTNNVTKLFIWSADSSEKVPIEQEIVLKSSNMSITNQLVQGFNFYTLPEGFLDKSNQITIHSQTGLPVIMSSELFNSNLVVNLRQYKDIAKVVYTFQNLEPFWLLRNEYWKDKKKRVHRDIDICMLICDQLDWNMNFNTKSNSVLMSLNLFQKSKERYNGVLQNLKDSNFKVNNRMYDYEYDVRAFTRRRDVSYMTFDIKSHIGTTNSVVYTFEYDIRSREENPVFINSISFDFTD